MLHLGNVACGRLKDHKCNVILIHILSYSISPGFKPPNFFAGKDLKNWAILSCLKVLCDLTSVSKPVGTPVKAAVCIVAKPSLPQKRRWANNVHVTELDKCRCVRISWNMIQRHLHYLEHDIWIRSLFPLLKTSSDSLMVWIYPNEAHEELLSHMGPV